MLKHISVILVNPHGSRNIGMAARAMKNFDITSLALIDPVNFKVREAHEMACGAKDIVDAAPRFKSLGEALADSIGPVQGHDTSGVTAMLRSAAKMDHSQFMGGLVTNVKFSPSLFARAEDRERIIDLLEGYFSMGGFEVQVNVVSGETLRRARAHPEDYAGMIVRVAGFSDYFTRLAPTLQDEIISRAEHSGV